MMKLALIRQGGINRHVEHLRPPVDLKIQVALRIKSQERK